MPNIVDAIRSMNTEQIFNPKRLNMRKPLMQQQQMPQGMAEQGNIDLSNRPVVHNPDGSVSTVRSMSFEDGNHSILVPTVSDDGRILSDDEAVDQYRKTGKHLGKFHTTGVTPWDYADRYAEALHNQYAQQQHGIQKTPFNITTVKK